jgi:putative transposase
MPRAQRSWIEHGLYHVFSRGSNRGSVVVNTRDLVDLEGVLFRTLKATGAEALAWALMPNHWHAVLRSPVSGLSELMRRVNHSYSIRFNRRWGRTAHLWENRFGCVEQRSERQLLWTLRYLVRNPIEAGLCASMADARWTSYPPTAGIADVPPGLAVDDVLRLFDSDPKLAVIRYRDFICSADSLPLSATSRPDKHGWA